MYKGKLFVIGVRIGNIKDITLRAIETLKNVKTILAEDTREFAKIAQHYGIKTKVISHHQHNEKDLIIQILGMLKTHDVALVSDRGTPLISDPGFLIIREMSRICPENISLVPGVSAVTAGFSVTSFSNRFVFLGFLKNSDFKEISNINYAIVIFEAPHRIKETLRKLLETMGNRNLVICRELTKEYQQIIYCNLSNVPDFIEKGEFTLVVEGRK